MRVRITQIDGSMPNIALMKLSHYHKNKGDSVVFKRCIERDLFEDDYDLVYASSIFKFSGERLERFLHVWPNAIIGGTGTNKLGTIEDITGGSYEKYDYSDTGVSYSIGFTQRGCRMKCKFCVVPEKEGKPRSVNTIYDIWRGDGHPKHIHILDNDFFGNPEWRDRAIEIIEGKFKVCLSQGINTRLINEESASALSQMMYMDSKFKTKRLYTAWDNLKDGDVFFKGVDILERAGISPKNLMTYMLIGFDKEETMARIFERFNRMIERGIMPFPMVFDRSNIELVQFQRWVIRRYYQFIPWEEYKRR